MTKTNGNKHVSKLAIPHVPKTVQQISREQKELTSTIVAAINRSFNSVPSMHPGGNGNSSAMYPATTTSSTTQSSRVLIRSSTQPPSSVVPRSNRSNQAPVQVATTGGPSSGLRSTAVRQVHGQVQSTSRPAIQGTSSTSHEACASNEARPGTSRVAAVGRRVEIQSPATGLSNDVLNERLRSPWTKINALAASSQSTSVTGTTATAGKCTEPRSVSSARWNAMKCRIQLYKNSAVNSSALPLTRSTSTPWSDAPLTRSTATPWSVAPVTRSTATPWSVAPVTRSTATPWSVAPVARSTSTAWSVAPVASTPVVYSSAMSSFSQRPASSYSTLQTRTQPTIKVSSAVSTQVQGTKTIALNMPKAGTSSATLGDQIMPVVSASVSRAPAGATPGVVAPFSSTRPYSDARQARTPQNFVAANTSLKITGVPSSSQPRNPSPQVTPPRSVPGTSMNMILHPISQVYGRPEQSRDNNPRDAPHNPTLKDVNTNLARAIVDELRNREHDWEGPEVDAGGDGDSHSDSERSDIDEDEDDDDEGSDDPEYESDICVGDADDPNDESSRDNNDDGDGDGDGSDPPQKPAKSDEDDPDTFVDKERGSDLLSGMYELYKSQELCDMTLLVNDQKFPCHRNVLAASSQYFKSMFTCNLAESTQNEVRINSIAPDILEGILKYLYTGSLKLSKDSVQDMISAADFLNLHRLKVGCSKYMMKQLDFSNALGVYFFAEVTGCEDLEEAAKEHVTLHFAKVIDTEEFVAMTAKNLQEILTWEFDIIEEITVYEAVIRWLEHDPDKRRDLVYEVFSNVRFAVIIERDRFFFFDKVMSNPLLTRNTLLKSLLDDVVHYSMLKERWVEFDFRTDDRGSRGQRYIVYTAKHYAESTHLNSLSYYYDFTNTRYPALNDLYSKSVSDVTLLGSGNKLFMLGGNKTGSDGSHITRKLHVWNCDTQQFQNHSKILSTRRKNFAFVQVDSDYFAVGGRKNGDIVATVDRFSSSTDGNIVSVMQKPLPNPLSSVCAIGFGGNLYVFGGEGVEMKRSRKNHYHVSDEVYCLNPKASDKWEVVGRMKQARAWAGCSVLDKKIYIIGGGYWDKKSKTKVVRALDSVEIYNPRDRSWSEGPPLPVPLISPGVIKYLDTIYVLGGKYENAASNSVYSLDQRHSEWQQMDDLFEQETRLSLECVSDCSYAVIDMPSNYNATPEQYSSEADSYGYDEEGYDQHSPESPDSSVSY